MFGILNSILYIVSNILLIITFLRFKKTNNKLNLVHWIVISLLLLFCYNSFVALLLSTFNIPVYLIILSIFNIMISLFLHFRKKEYQQYYIEKKDVIANILFIALVFFIMIIRFGIPFNISYETCDPGVHFWTAKDFYEQSFLLNKVTDKTVVNFETRQAASYTNVGLAFKTASPIVDDFDLYIIYILYDVYMLYLAVSSFYILICNVRSKKTYLLSIILSILYVLGYPLNNMLFGFFYSGHAVTLISLILILFKYYKDNDFDRKAIYILLGLSSFGLFFTYYFYVPVVFISMFLWMFYDDIKNKRKIISKEFVVKNLYIFLGACILGFLYYILPNLGNSETSISTQINLDGYYYNNVISNFIPFIPIILFSYCYFIKKKDVKVEHFMFICLLIFMGIILYLMFNNQAVGYYLSKNYYLLWLVTFVIFSDFLLTICEKYCAYVYMYIIFVLSIIFATMFGIERKIINLEDWTINKSSPSNLLYVYTYNYGLIFSISPDFTHEELEMLHEAYKMEAFDLQNNASYNLIDRVSWLCAWFRKKPVVDVAENVLFTYLTANDYAELFDNYEDRSQFNLDNVSYQRLDYNNANWFLLLYRRYDADRTDVIVNEYVPQGKEMYDLIDRSTCNNCTFYDFDDGLLIYKP